MEDGHPSPPVCCGELRVTFSPSQSSDSFRLTPKAAVTSQRYYPSLLELNARNVCHVPVGKGNGVQQSPSRPLQGLQECSHAMHPHFLLPEMITWVCLWGRMETAAALSPPRSGVSDLQYLKWSFYLSKSRGMMLCSQMGTRGWVSLSACTPAATTKAHILTFSAPSSWKHWEH